MRTAHVILSSDYNYRGNRIQEIIGYTHMEVGQHFVHFVVPDGKGVRNIFYNIQNVLEIETNSKE